MTGQKTSKSTSLARNLAITFSVFVLLSSLLLTGWMTWRQQRQSLQELKKRASINASVITELRLPKSRELAKKLSHILDVGVGFHFKNGQAGDWPQPLNEVIEDLVKAHTSAATRVHGYAIAIAPFPDNNTSLILIRQSKPLFPNLLGAALIPAAVFSLACAMLAILIGRSLVQPLTTLADWLPNLNSEAGKKHQAIPATITHRRDEIGMLAQALEQTCQNLRHEQQLRRQSERLATLGRIATSLAHEIRNPAAAIGLHADLLAESVNEADLQSIELIREEVDRITDLVNQWLFVARSAPTRKEPHDLNQLINNVARRLRPVLQHAHAELSIELPKTDTVRVQVDAPRIEQSLRNLLINAAQAMPEGGQITAKLKTSASSAILTIEDQGKGFSEQALLHFGEAFFSEKEGGMGIGLTLACEVIEAHGGSLSPSTSTSPPGACLTLTLPLSK